MSTCTLLDDHPPCSRLRVAVTPGNDLFGGRLVRRRDARWTRCVPPAWRIGPANTPRCGGPSCARPSGATTTMPSTSPRAAASTAALAACFSPLGGRPPLPTGLTHGPRGLSAARPCACTPLLPPPPGEDPGLWGRSWACSFAHALLVLLSLPALSPTLAAPRSLGPAFALAATARSEARAPMVPRRGG